MFITFKKLTHENCFYVHLVVHITFSQKLSFWVRGYNANVKPVFTTA